MIFSYSIISVSIISFQIVSLHTAPSSIFFSSMKIRRDDEATRDLNNNRMKRNGAGISRGGGILTGGE